MGQSKKAEAAQGGGRLEAGEVDRDRRRASAAIGYGLSQMSNIAYGEAEIKVVDFSGLDATQKRHALEAANAARCTCGCGMTLAQCVATDSTCPIREDNIDKLKAIVSDAARTKS